MHHRLQMYQISAACHMALALYLQNSYVTVEVRLYSNEQFFDGPTGRFSSILSFLVCRNEFLSLVKHKDYPWAKLKAIIPISQNSVNYLCTKCPSNISFRKINYKNLRRVFF